VCGTTPGNVLYAELYRGLAAVPTSISLVRTWAGVADLWLGLSGGRRERAGGGGGVGTAWDGDGAVSAGGAD
jgi:hypothetical protein